MNTNGLREQIAHAKSIAEINSLLNKCETFTDALKKTKRQWINTAKRRVKELQTVPTSIEKSEKPKKEAKKKDK